jgi:hypothetical protein
LEEMKKKGEIASIPKNYGNFNPFEDEPKTTAKKQD